MIKYIVDTDKKYKDDILFHLRAHNKSHTGEKATETKHIYIHQEDELIGAVTINLSWDWAGFVYIYYKDIDILKELVSRAIKSFEKVSVGIKTYTRDDSIINDLCNVGFKRVGSLYDAVYLDLVDYSIISEQEYTVIESNEENETFHPRYKQFIEAFKKENDVPSVIEEYSIVALDNDIFVGGVTLELYKDTMYVDLLVVSKDYRGQRIGSELMRLAENDAKNHNLKSIDLGTTEFQAREFYEKLGYKVEFTRQDFPKGYECHTLNKALKRSE